MKHTIIDIEPMIRAELEDNDIPVTSDIIKKVANYIWEYDTVLDNEIRNSVTWAVSDLACSDADMYPTYDIASYLELIRLNVEHSIKTVEELYDYIEDNCLGYWSYCVEDIAEVKDHKHTVLVKDSKGNKRLFETTPTL